MKPEGRVEKGRAEPPGDRGSRVPPAVTSSILRSGQPGVQGWERCARSLTIVPMMRAPAHPPLSTCRPHLQSPLASPWHVHPHLQLAARVSLPWLNTFAGVLVTREHGSRTNIH